MSQSMDQTLVLVPPLRHYILPLEIGLNGSWKHVLTEQKFHYLDCAPGFGRLGHRPQDYCRISNTFVVPQANPV